MSGVDSKKWQKSKPGFVHPDTSGLLIIYLGKPLPACSCNLPFPATCLAASYGAGRALPPIGGAGVYLVLQPMRFTLPQCRHEARRLLPCVFTLSPSRHVGAGWLFSVALSVRCRTLPLASMVPCVARTFLPDCSRR